MAAHVSHIDKLLLVRHNHGFTVIKIHCHLIVISEFTSFFP